MGKVGWEGEVEGEVEKVYIERVVRNKFYCTLTMQLITSDVFSSTLVLYEPTP